MGRILKDHQKLIEKLSEISTMLRISQQLDVPAKDLTIEIIEEIGDVQGKLNNIKRYYIDQLSSPQSNSQPEQPTSYQTSVYELSPKPTVLSEKVPEIVKSSQSVEKEESLEHKVFTVYADSHKVNNIHKHLKNYTFKDQDGAEWHYVIRYDGDDNNMAVFDKKRFGDELQFCKRGEL